MNQDDYKKLLNEALDPIKKQLEDPDTGLAAINNRLNDPDNGLAAINNRLNDPDNGLAAISKRLNDPDTGLTAINRRLDANTAAVVELESTIKGYADAYKTNKTNIERLDDRVIQLEDKTGIIPPPELTIQR